MTNTEFIKQIGAAAKKYYSTYKILPSMTIAQAILESSWNNSTLANECYNYFGMKWTSSCGCDYKEYKTTEQNTDGSTYTVTAKFRKYSSLATGIKGYYDFLNYSRYKNLKGVTDYNESCKLIKEDGWATDTSYTTKLVALIEKYDLWEYDISTIGKPSGTISKSADFYNVLWLQYKLNACLDGVSGFTTLTLDGDYGTKTKNAVLQYWKKLGWNTDGKSSGLTVASGTITALATGRTK